MPARHFNKIRKMYSQLRKDIPGERFVNFYKRRQDGLRCHPVKKAFVYVTGVVLILAGFVLGFVPGAPGIVLGIPGFAFIASQSRGMARILDRSEIRARRLLNKIRMRFS